MDNKTLVDVQSIRDSRGIDLQRVGVKNVEIPLNIIQKDGQQQIATVKATLTVDLPHHFKGTHMSRFIEILNEWRSKKLLSIDLEGCLKQTIEKLNASNSYIILQFKYFIEKEAPVSSLIAPMGYNCAFEGVFIDNKYDFFLSVNVPITTLCPCSKEISDYGAHNQRAIVKVKISYAPDQIVWIEDLVNLIESTGSSPVYPILKREDEKYVTEKAYNNPKFVEDVIRDLVNELRQIDIIKWYEVECEAFESIHNHSAWAYQKELIKKNK
ncbi:MAG: GTP cyclohydrolase FolE2 [Cyanobacteriota bacterium]